MSISVKQSASYAGNNRWNWAIWLTGSAAELDQIKQVTYTLHPSFPNPVRVIRAKRDGFRLQSNGWGEFRIYIDILFRDGEHTQLSHDLKLTEEAEQTEPSHGKQIAASIAELAHQTSIKGTVKKLMHTMVEHATEHLPELTLFISGGVADAPTIERLRAALVKLNMQILSADDVPVGVPFAVHIENLIAQADIVVFMLSSRPSLWMNHEIEVAKRHEKRIVPILVGDTDELPESLQDYQYLKIENPLRIANLAQRLLRD